MSDTSGNLPDSESPDGTTPHPGAEDKGQRPLAEDARQAAEQALSAAQQAVDDLTDDQGRADGTVLTLPEFGNGDKDSAPLGIELLSQVNLQVRIELGRTRMLVEDVLRLNEGSVVELDKLAGDPVDVYVNDRHVARGEVLVLNDSFCVRINEIVTQPRSLSHQQSDAEELVG